MSDLVPCIQSSGLSRCLATRALFPTMDKGTFNTIAVLGIVTSIRRGGNCIQYFIASVSAEFLLRKPSNFICNSLPQGCLQHLAKTNIHSMNIGKPCFTQG